MSEIPDWLRLQKALSVEAERGFGDVVGREHRFSEFLCLSFGKPPPGLAADDRRRWRDTADQFSRYPTLNDGQRRHLVAMTRSFLYKVQRFCEGAATQIQAAAAIDPPEPGTAAAAPAPRKDRRPKTQPIALAANGPEATTLARTYDLELPLGKVNGIGPRGSARLARLGLLTVRDLLFYFPRDYLDYGRLVTISELEPGEMVTIIGTVKRCNCFTSQKNSKLTIFELVLRDRTGHIRLSKFFAGARFAGPAWQQSQKKLYPPGASVAASGLVKEDRHGLSIAEAEIEVIDTPNGSIASMTVGRVVPVYPLTEGVTADLVRRSVAAVIPAATQVKEALPRDFRDRLGLMGLAGAIAQVHFPNDEEMRSAARRRLVFDEFFYLQLGLLVRRQRLRASQVGVPLVPKGELMGQFYDLLPFELTGAQNRVVNEILQDLQKSVPMNRLVQGDVGSGKTVVAVIAILAAIQSGYQAALMAPTEVLAEQHYRKIVEWFNQLHVPVELLTGSTGLKKRREIHSQLQTGELPLLVGTHALIQDGVQFDRLGLVIIDEQHRFGVEQRAKLTNKGVQPHVLTLTATPIPRTLALTIHGELDTSQIDELPPGRQAIQTSVLRAGDRPHAYDLIRREVAQGRQAYLVFPLIEESEKLDLKSAIEEHKKLSEVIFPECTVGLLHGRMSSAEKDAVISQFRANELQLLVSTTVIEVGVDVPNATVMMIEHAERFGLSQLHQLRGRVGRGADQSYCLLVNSSKTETALQRLAVLAQSQDGFWIAEMDLKFRGPGEMLGKRQAGLPDFALASLADDREVLDLARQAAEALLTQDPSLENHPRIQQELGDRTRKLLGGALMT